MKAIINCIVVLFFVSACTDAIDKSPDQASNDTIIVYKHDTVSNSLPYAAVLSVYNGEVSKGDLIHTKGMRLLNNPKGYKIVSFECSDADYRKGYKVKNEGPFFNAQLISLFENVNPFNAKLCFENIRIVGPDNDTILANPVILRYDTYRYSN
jgi:hypothetical protein